MRYPILERSKAQQLIDLRRANEVTDADLYVDYRGEGSDFDDSFIQPLKQQIDDVRINFPSVLGSKDPEGGRFEAEASAIVHKCIPSTLGTALTDPDFWRYLAVVHL